MSSAEKRATFVFPSRVQ